MHCGQVESLVEEKDPAEQIQSWLEQGLKF